MSGYGRCLRASAKCWLSEEPAATSLQPWPCCAVLRAHARTRTHSHTSWLRGNGREQMGRDLLQSHIKAMTKPRPERRVTSCSVHPRCATGTVPAAAASTTCSSPCLSGGSFVPVQHSLGFSSAAAGPRSRRGQASLSLAVQPPAPMPGSARGGFRWRRTNLFTSGDWRHLKVGRSNWHLMSQLSQGREKQDSKQGRHLLACVLPALPVLPAAPAKLRSH